MLVRLRLMVLAGLSGMALLAAPFTGQAADPVGKGPPPGLSFSGDSLHLTPPAGATVTEYTIHYITPERLAAGERWGIWARQWPVSVPDINLATAQSKAGCETLGTGAACNRPPALGEHAPGKTFIYRAFARSGGQWSAASPTLSVTRP